MAARTNPIEYRVAQLQARARESALSEQALINLSAALEDYAQDLAAELSRLKGSPLPLIRLRLVREAYFTVQRAGQRLEALMARITQEAREASFREVLEIWRIASQEAHKRVRLARRLLPSAPRVELSMAGAFESLGGASRHWRTLLRGYTQDAVAETQTIVREAILRGMPPRDLARRLRPYVQGAETFHQAFGRTEIEDFMLQAPGFNQAARKLLFNADRIAYSEIHNARHEAERQRYAADPLVAAVGWRLSPNRGSTRVPDVCNFLATGNFYRLGPGVYPVALVPIPPHPHDRCELVPIVRQANQAHLPKPEPPLSFDENTLSFPEGTTEARQGLVRRQVRDSLEGIRIHPASGRTRALIETN